MRGRMSQSDRAASKGLQTTGELDASTTTYWNGGTPKYYSCCFARVPRDSALT
jgi:hypothetical protein